MARRERDLGRERRWRGVLARQAASGLNVRAFCRREAIAESAFHCWRRTIRARDGKVQPTTSASPAPKFLPASIISAAAREASTLELAGGHVLRMPGISVEELADFVAALAGRLPR